MALFLIVVGLYNVADNRGDGAAPSGTLNEGSHDDVRIAARRNAHKPSIFFDMVT